MACEVFQEHARLGTLEDHKAGNVLGTSSCCIVIAMGALGKSAATEKEL